ncbi:alpha/beta fold hydrolase [Parasphingorhabdus pacifica]
MNPGTGDPEAPRKRRRTPFGMHQDIVDTPRGRIECLRNAPDPSTRPVSITVNGLAETSHRWGPALVQAARLGHTAYAYDHIGQFSSRETSPRTVRELADDLRALIDELSPEQPVHVVGGCLGGFVARDLAYRAPHRVRSLVLLGSGWSLADSAAPRLHEQVAHAVATEGITAVFDKIREEAVRAGVSHRSVDRVQDSYLAIRPDFLADFSGSVADYPDTTDRLPFGGAIAVPVLVTHGSGDDMWNTDRQHRLAERLSAPITTIEGAGHSPTVTHPRATADALARFWSAVDSGAPITPQPELDTSSA